jgi:hypothetical protein
MDFQIDPHTVERAANRGATLAEVEEVVASGVFESARGGRFARWKVFPFGKERNGRYYPEKRVKVIYVIDNGQIVTVTVFVYYGRWE